MPTDHAAHSVVIHLPVPPPQRDPDPDPGGHAVPLPRAAHAERTEAMARTAA